MASERKGPSPTDERTGERSRLLDTVRRLLVGPMQADEVLENVPPEVDPTDFYLSGILWPRYTVISAQEDEPASVENAGKANDDTEDDGAPLFSVFRPSSIGLTCSVKADATPIVIKLRAARYVAESRPESGTGPETAANVNWQRQPLTYSVRIPANEKPHAWSTSTFENERGETLADPSVAAHIRLRIADGVRIVTATFINNAERPEASRPGPVCLFQTSLLLSAEDSEGRGAIVARRSDSAIPGDDALSGDLLFRNDREFAAGHGIAVNWPPPDNHSVSQVETTWIPDRAVYGVSRNGHTDLAPLRDQEQTVFAAALLANASERVKTITQLESFCTIYEAWTAAQLKRVATLPTGLRGTARTHLEQCVRAADRIRQGVQLVASDDAAYRAFTLANAAMDDYFSSPHRGPDATPLIWAPFQLAFFLLTLPSIVDPANRDRSTLDLLWFPTGGGKTEAYLAISLFTIFHRRLLGGKGREEPHADVLMRYTLRLLTVQQFQRAAAVICRADLLRERNAKELGKIPISIGLYVGQGATPNRVLDGESSALKMLEAEAGGLQPSCTPRLLSRCPMCDATLSLGCYKVNAAVPAVEVRCANSSCPSKGRILPIYTVDEDIYRERPSLIIGTIDKFAQLPRKREVGVLFGGANSLPPSLIIQDELHLISGPLGTITGLYETAIDLLCTRGGHGPKVIGSTATIGGAANQVRALFDRGLMQFPPPAIDAEDSFFAVRDLSVPDRRYAAISSSGRSPKFLLQSTAAACIIAAQYLLDAGSKPLSIDPYWTVLMYFNSLRELGGAMVMMRDDVPRTVQFFASRLAVTPRAIEGEPEELTSRIASTKIPAILDKLQVMLDADPFRGAPADTVLASNMISVGVDIPRLGLMLVNGQPKTTAEYIQATSRVGRGLPGLVFTLLNAARPRDMSHFEHFAHYHDTLYRRVEVTSVTPWSPRARDRALHAVFIAAVRHLSPNMADRFAAVDFLPDDEAVVEILAGIRERAVRAGQSFVSRDDIEQELNDIAERWARRARQHRDANRKLEYWATLNPFNHRPTQDHLMRAAEESATDPEVWLTPNSMREVEPSAWYVVWPERK